MMIKITKQIITIVLLIYIFYSCEYITIEPEEIKIEGEVSFKNDIIPIFNKSCNSACHSPGKGGYSQLDLTPDNSYDDISVKSMVDTTSPETSPLYSKLVKGHFDDATPTDYTLILEWIKQGAKNN